MISVEILDDGGLAVINGTVSDGINFEKVKFKFPNKWDGYVKTAVFSYENAAYSIVLQPENPLCVSENECYIPFEVLKPPMFYLSVFGVKGDSRATTKSVAVGVEKSGYAEGETPAEPTPNLYQQLVNLATETKLIAQSVRDDANSGMFIGERGPRGEMGPQGIQGDKGPKGDDYIITQADKNEMVEMVIAALPNGDEVNY